MELGKHIRKYRAEANISQEELADRVFVSRQTISNWENNKSYPDIKSLVLMSEIFHVSLDQLIKGDLEKMKQEIDAQEYTKFKKDSNIFAGLFIALLMLPIPLAELFGWFGIAVYAMVFTVAMVYAIRVEKYKKKYNIQTYKEIVAFTEGKTLDQLEKAKEEGKRPYQKFLLAVCFGILTLLVAAAIAALISLFA